MTFRQQLKFRIPLDLYILQPAGQFARALQPRLSLSMSDGLNTVLFLKYRIKIGCLFGLDIALYLVCLFVCMYGVQLDDYS